jgi:hypothetical protein
MSRLLVCAVVLLAALPARAQESPFASFQSVGERVVAAFTTATDGVRNVRIDFRRRDTAPEADVTLIGMLAMDIKPKGGAAWYSIRLLLGHRDGHWTYLTAFHELPSQAPVWAEADGWYRTVVEQAIEGSGR